MDKIKTVKIKNPDGSVSEETYTISVDAKNVDMKNGKELQETIGTVNIDTDGNIGEQLNNLNESVNNINININNLNVDIKKKAYFFNTITDMKNANLKVGDYACTLGYYEPNDGGAGDYKIINGDYEDDNGNYHKLENNLFAKLIIKNNVFPEQFGAYGDGIHNDSAAINKILSLGFNIQFYGNKNYLVENTIEVQNNTFINGNNCSLILKNSATAFNIIGDNNIIQNFRIYKGNYNYYGINIHTGTNNNKIMNISGFNLTYSLIMNDGINSIIENCYAYMCGWDCVSNYTASKNALIENCKAIMCGRHGFSTDSGAEHIIFQDCYAENIGFIDGEGHTSFHLEGAKDCIIRNCRAVYNENHKVFSETFSGLLLPCRIEGQYNNEIDGLEIDIDGNFSAERIYWLYVNYISASIIPQIKINNIQVYTNTQDTLLAYLGVSHLYIKNSNFNGKISFKQIGNQGQIKQLENCTIDTKSLTIPFYQPQYKVEDSYFANNIIKNSKSLIEGRVINSTFYNNNFINCEESVYFKEQNGDSSAKSQNIIFKNNIIENCTTAIHLSWAGDEKIFIYNNTFKGVFTTILKGNYITVHFFNNIKQNLTYTTGIYQVTISSEDDSLVLV